MSVLVNEVENASGTTATPIVDDNLIQSIVESEAFKAAATSVGVSTAAAIPGTSTTSVGTSMMNMSNNSSSEGSSLLNSGGGMVGETEPTLLQTPVMSVTIAPIDP